MAIICTPEYLDRVAKENPEMTFLEYIAISIVFSVGFFLGAWWHSIHE